MARESSAPWWQEKNPTTVAQYVYGLVASVEANAAQWRARSLLFASFAAGRPFGDINFGVGYSMSSNRSTSFDFDPTWSAPSQNVIRVAIQTLQSTIGASQPFVNFLTDGADFNAQCAAKRATRFVDAVYEAESAYKETSKCFRDLLVFGTAYAKVWRRSDKTIGVRRVLPDNLWVDPVDGHAGRPRSLYERVFVSKEELIAAYPKHEAAIMSSQPPFPFLRQTSARDTNDITAVVEGWHLPVGDKKGRHVIALQSTLLLDEPWELPVFPFAVARYNELHAGWLGQGLVEQLLPMQVEVDYLSRNISDSHHRIGHPYIVNPIASGVPAEHFDDRNARIIEPTTIQQAPVYMVPQVMPPESYAYLEACISRMFKESGVSELAAAALKPRGLDSGEALREYADQASMRFQKLGKDFEVFHEDIAKLIVLTADAKGAVVALPSRQVKWEDVKWDSSPVAKAYPVSTLPFTPAARKQQIEEDFQKGDLSLDDYLRLRNNPDLGAWVSEQTAGRVLVEQQIDQMLEGGRYQSPSKYQDLAAAVQIGTKRWNLGKLRGYQANQLGLLSRYIDDAAAKLGASTPQPAPQASAQPVAAMVPGAAPPMAPPALAPAAPVAPMAA